MLEAETINRLTAVWTSGDTEPSPEDVESTLQTYRALRNSCASGAEFQSACTANVSIVNNTFKILQVLLKSNNENCLVCARVVTQFLGNLVVNHRANQILVWMIYGSLLKQMLAMEDSKLKNNSSMIVYVILLGLPDYRAPKALGTDMLLALLKSPVMDSEFALFAVELLIGTAYVLEESYPSLDSECRLRLLEVIHDMLLTMPECSTKLEEKKKKDATKNEPTCKILMSSVKFMVEQFKRRSFLVLKTSAHYADSLEPREVCKLIEVVACASSKDPYISELQNDRSLLIDCIFLLKGIHMAGQAGDNNFTPITKLSELTITSKGTDTRLEQHPAFGFKACLVRLLGNLCWRHRENQEQMRDLEGIPLLLDCCTLDARNPLMLQWVVLAIRNLCENNKENQAVIARMSHKGTVDTRMLQELGFTLHSDEKSNKVRIVPLKSK